MTKIIIITMFRYDLITYEFIGGMYVQSFAPI